MKTIAQDKKARNESNSKKNRSRVVGMEGQSNTFQSQVNC